MRAYIPTDIEKIVRGRTICEFPCVPPCEIKPCDIHHIDGHNDNNELSNLRHVCENHNPDGELRTRLFQLIDGILQAVHKGEQNGALTALTKMLPTMWDEVYGIRPTPEPENDPKLEAKIIAEGFWIQYKALLKVGFSESQSIQLLEKI